MADPQRTFAALKRKWGPESLPGPTLACWLNDRFGDCRSGWEMAKCLRVSRAAGIAARCARLPGYRLSRLRVSTGLSPQPFRWSKRTGNHRPHRFTGVRSLCLRWGSGCDRIARGRNVGSGPKSESRCSVFPSEGSGPLFHCRSASFEPGRSHVPRLTSRPLAKLPLRSVFAALQACFPAFRRPRSVGWRTLIRGRIAYRSSLCFSGTCVPIRSRFFLRDKAKLRSVGESRKTYFCHLSTGCVVAVDNAAEAILPADTQLRSRPAGSRSRVSCDHGPPEGGAAAR